MTWQVEALPEVLAWMRTLDNRTRAGIDGAVQVLSAEGPRLGRPLVDKINRSNLHHLKELRPGSSGHTEVRILFAFDPRRHAILLVAGDKAEHWNAWYEKNIPLAERRYEDHLQRIDEELR
ncbi:type II toxin-antitoxin system RelE/ParE family toxin [Saccharopolyspora sp. 5N708]|uniref:type II toxin-antitoxin system RelE/ParE family toxin n=1 Tax=Saccharopolyspora sp. 5N708 TaxID=3457424 RepID=UPI003FCFB1FC